MRKNNKKAGIDYVIKINEYDLKIIQNALTLGCKTARHNLNYNALHVYNETLLNIKKAIYEFEKNSQIKKQPISMRDLY
jgi:hypothetical protein